MHVKVICLNLWQGGNLFPNILPFLKEQDADILLLQEVYDSEDRGLVENYRSMQVLREELDYKYDVFAPVVLDKLLVGEIDSGNAVFSKFPIVSSEAHFFDRPYDKRDPHSPEEWAIMPRNLQHIVINAGTELNVFNFQGVWDLDGDNFSPQRERMRDVILENTAGKNNVILAGDTNAKPTNQAMRDIEVHLLSVFGDELTTTFNMRRKTNPGYATAAVDLMYVSHNIKVVEKSCPDIDISDHLPLIVTLDVQEAK